MISERLRYSLYLEQSYLDLDPECDNIRVLFPFYENLKSICFINRFGRSVLRYNKTKKSFISIKFRQFANPARIKKSITSYIDVHVDTNYHLYVHKIMANLFIDNQNVFAIEVDHKNGDIYNNNAFNLEWVTPEENIRRRWAAYYTKHNKPVPEHYKTEANYMSYLNYKNHVIRTKKS